MELGRENVAVTFLDTVVIVVVAELENIVPQTTTPVIVAR